MSRSTKRAVTIGAMLTLGLVVSLGMVPSVRRYLLMKSM